MAAKVYFIPRISPEATVEAFDALGVTLPGKVAVKLHSGEVGNQNFLRPAFCKALVDHVGGTIVECNTAYPGKRNTTELHRETMKLHGWTDIAPVDIMDAEGEIALPVEGGLRLTENYVGAHLENYDSMLVLSHFKGHPMGGFGGALKNISIGIASSHGKTHIHGGGEPGAGFAGDQVAFLEAMADAAGSIVKRFGEKIVFVNVMCNMSVDCDCCAVAEDPKVADIGVLASVDPVALDQACVDLVYASKEPGKKHLIERIESRKGIHTVEAAAQLGIGSRAYELVQL